MTAIECTREQDVLDAVASGRWSDELRAHAASCAVCADVADVASAFREDHDAAWQDAHVPPSGRVWWRAELRARQEAARAAASPIGFVHGVAAACAVGLALALLGVLWPASAGSLGAASTWIASAATLIPYSVVVSLAVALGAALVLTPIALYFVFSEK